MIPELGLGLLALAALAFAARERSRASSAQAAAEGSRAAAEAANRARVEAERRLAALQAEAAAEGARSAEGRQALEAALAEATSRGLSANAALARVRADLDRQREVNLSLQQELAGRDGELDLARKDRRTLAQARQALQTRLAELEGELDALRQEHEGRRRALLRAETERSRLAHVVEQLHEQRAEQEALAEAKEALAAELEQARDELERLRAAPQRSSSRVIARRIQELNGELGELREQRDAWLARAREAEDELARLGAEDRDEALLQEREALRAQVERLEASLRRVADTRAALRVLGVPAAAPNDALFAPERRAHSEAALRDVYLAAGASAAAILDRRGVAWARCGNATPLERLAASATLLHAEGVEAALGRPAQLMSEAFGAYGRHVVRLGETGLALGVSSSRECPALALRLAALRLVGAAPLAGQDVGAPPVLDLHPLRSDRLGAWALRRDALAVAVFSEEEPAGTDSVFAGACAPLVEATRALYRRAARDGFASGFVLLWRGEDDVTLAARALEDGETVAFAKFNAPPPPRVLDDLLATVRWLGAAQAS
ncbi:MAG: hypothetical protein H6741_25605 [Alphaproteobacteria bacterium]|nr:hypothetical protein [Alphaproteobacteria bacterium]MCB9796087.1 hypothetical protein [Alphaproteobacteria bacterium]